MSEWDALTGEQCRHTSGFEAVIVVHKDDIEEAWYAAVKVRCKGCEVDMEFLCPRTGFLINDTAIAPGGLEARLPLRPARKGTL